MEITIRHVPEGKMEEFLRFFGQNLTDPHQPEDESLGERVYYIEILMMLEGSVVPFG